MGRRIIQEYSACCSTGAFVPRVHLLPYCILYLLVDTDTRGTRKSDNALSGVYVACDLLLLEALLAMGPIAYSIRRLQRQDQYMYSGIMYVWKGRPQGEERRGAREFNRWCGGEIICT